MEIEARGNQEWKVPAESVAGFCVVTGQEKFPKIQLFKAVIHSETADCV